MDDADGLLELKFDGVSHWLRVHVDEPLALLEAQIFSCTEVYPDEQACTLHTADGTVLSDTLSEFGGDRLALLAELAREASACATLTRRPPPPPPTPAPAPNPILTAPMERRILSGLETARLHDDADEQRKAREVIPWDELVAKAAEAAATARAAAAAVAADDEWRLRELLRWFKFGFFSWVDKPKCEVSGQPASEFVGMAPPNAEERAGGASRVEVYRGPTGHLTRFARLNVPSVLLSERHRRGRCGEFANAFTLCCRAVGYDARWVLDLTDHVWCEVWLTSRGRWVHADPCENALDAPLMYERGWGKRLTYVLAFSRHEVCDVSARYSARWEETLARRTEVKEGWLELTIASINQRLQAPLSPTRRAAIGERGRAERAELDALSSPPPPAEATSEGAEAAAPAAAGEAEREAGSADGADASDDPLRRGRQTGSLEWRKARGETGE